MFGSIDISSWGTEKFGLSASGLNSSVTMLSLGFDSVVKGMLKMLKCDAGIYQVVQSAIISILRSGSTTD